MAPLFEELDYRVTPLGTLVLRRRRDLATGEDIHEIKLNDEFLMSSKFTTSEKALATLALAELDGDELEIAVGGLGLGYTAVAALESPKVRSMLVVEALGPVIEWHQSGLLPLGATLSQDPRCRFVHGDFFALALADGGGFDADAPGKLLDAILLDIDHSPSHVLNPGNAELYTAEGLAMLAARLRPAGIFAMWSNDREDEAFTRTLASVFAQARAEPVVFHNPLQERDAHQCVYLARTAPEGP